MIANYLNTQFDPDLSASGKERPTELGRLEPDNLSGKSAPPLPYASANLSYALSTFAGQIDLCPAAIPLSAPRRNCRRRVLRRPAAVQL